MVFTPQGKHTLSHRVFVTIFVCAMAVIVAFTVLGAFFVQNTLADATSANLAQETELIAAALDEQQEPIPFLRSLDREDLRITLINKDGSVAYDNEASPSTLPNHGDRPEVIEAFESGSGSAERASSTLDEIMLYRAVTLDNGQVVRLAQAQPGVAAILLSMLAPMLLIAAAGAVLSFFMARRESRAIIAPLQEVDLDHPRRSYEHAYAEMVPMLERIESQRQELKRQMAVLADNDRMRREFTANITHELKTPLTAISGYAELIANGMVEGEDDLRNFGGRIYREAGRLAALVNDILTLSNLDEAERATEGEAVPIGSTEPIELSRAIYAVEQRLEQVVFHPHPSGRGIALDGDAALLRLGRFYAQQRVHGGARRSQLRRQRADRTVHAVDVLRRLVRFAHFQQPADHLQMVAEIVPLRAQRAVERFQLRVSLLQHLRLLLDAVGGKRVADIDDRAANHQQRRNAHQCRDIPPAGARFNVRQKHQQRDGDSRGNLHGVENNGVTRSLFDVDCSPQIRPPFFCAHNARAFRAC